MNNYFNTDVDQQRISQVSWGNQKKQINTTIIECPDPCKTWRENILSASKQEKQTVPYKEQEIYLYE